MVTCIKGCPGSGVQHHAKKKAQLKVLHCNGDQDLGSSHLYLCCDQALHLPFTGIQDSLQLHAMQAASGHALE